MTAPTHPVRFILNTEHLPKPVRINELAVPGFDTSQGDFPSQTRVTAQRATALYYEMLTLTLKVDSAGTVGNTLGVQCHRTLAFGAQVHTHDTRARVTRDLIAGVASPVYRTTVAPDPRWTLKKHMTPASAFVAFMREWETDLQMPLLTMRSDIIDRDAYNLDLHHMVASEPMFVPLGKGDLDALDSARVNQIISNAALNMADQFARALSPEAGLSSALAFYEAGEGTLPRDSVMGKLVTALFSCSRSVDPASVIPANHVQAVAPFPGDVLTTIAPIV
jgi:hypothetical protein